MTRSQRLSQRRQLRLRLLQIEPHVHLAVHRRRDGEVLLRLLTLARAPVELAEAEMAVAEPPHSLEDRALEGLGAGWVADLVERIRVA